MANHFLQHFQLALSCYKTEFLNTELHHIFMRALHYYLKLECYKNHPPTLQDAIYKVLDLKAYYIKYNLI